ncbi:MAG TPA: hypothetical protein VJ953_18490 [Saprospiraceae bacterium]|nr:hypothetical protein [Saprospiraceae bacterium]
MDLLYGTYLTFLVKNTIHQSTGGITVKQIEQSIHLYPTRRQRINFRKRIRQALKSLYENNVISRQEAKSDGNLIVHKYYINVKQED